MTDSDIKEASNGSVDIMNSDRYLELEEKGKEPTQAILNLDHDGNGSHWTAIEKINKNIYRYEDSFGIVPPFKFSDKIIFYSPYKKQESWESNCGARALNAIR